MRKALALLSPRDRKRKHRALGYRPLLSPRFCSWASAL